MRANFVAYGQAPLSEPDIVWTARVPTATNIQCGAIASVSECSSHESFFVVSPPFKVQTDYPIGVSHIRSHVAGKLVQ